ncbi:neurotrophin-7 [Alosa alosa]|nr:neurotrophin-7 [Alosa alosa]
MRSLTLVLLLLNSVQAALNMGEDAPTPPMHHPHHTHHQQQQQQRHTTAQQSHSQSHSHSNSNSHSKHGGGGQHRSPDSRPELIPTVDPKLFNKRRYHSPRVLFSDVVPPDSKSVRLAAGMGQGRGQGLGWDQDPRVRRGATEQIMHRGEYSVCDSMNHWVSNKTRATDMAGNEVTVLPDVRINNQVKKQLFYETSCRFASTRPSGGGGKGGAGGGKGKGGKGNQGRVRTGSGGCRGIDTRFWNSYCTNTHTFVRALTLYQNQITWRYIRINAACVCVISRTSWKG